MAVSDTPTAWAIVCLTHGKVYLTERQFKHQRDHSKDYYWRCPYCGRIARFDIDNLEEFIRTSK